MRKQKWCRCAGMVVSFTVANFASLANAENDAVQVPLGIAQPGQPPTEAESRAIAQEILDLPADLPSGWKVSCASRMPMTTVMFARREQSLALMVFPPLAQKDAAEVHECVTWKKEVAEKQKQFQAQLQKNFAAAKLNSSPQHPPSYALSHTGPVFDAFTEEGVLPVVGQLMAYGTGVPVEALGLPAPRRDNPNSLLFYGVITPKGAGESISVEGDFKSPEELQAIKSLMASIKNFKPQAYKPPAAELRKQASSYMDWNEPLPQSLELVGIQNLFLPSICFAPKSAAKEPRIDANLVFVIEVTKVPSTKYNAAELARIAAGKESAQPTSGQWNPGKSYASVSSQGSITVCGAPASYLIGKSLRGPECMTVYADAPGAVYLIAAHAPTGQTLNEELVRDFVAHITKLH